MKKFSNSFMIGAATAAYQVEGNNVGSDCWVMENIQGTNYREPSLNAVDHYHRYREDIKMLKDSGLSAYRFSIEWARIEPAKGYFDRKEIQHYKDVLNYCHQLGLTPIVTLHHFSSPRWLISEGGWENEATVEYFGEYCKYVVSELRCLMPYICTINEANIGVQIGRSVNEYKAKRARTTEGKLDNVYNQVGFNLERQSIMEKYHRALREAFRIDSTKVQVFLAPRTKEGDRIIMKCHERARQVIKSINSNIKVGATMSLYDYQALPGGEQHVEALWNEDFLHYLPYLQGDDFFGVQNYTRKVYGLNGKINPNEYVRMTESGGEFYPESLAGVLRFVSKHWKKPILVTENGISTSNDSDRIEFIERVMRGLDNCLEEGINVIGYIHRSLLDCFEWQKGYGEKFGLIAVDRKTQTRYPKESLMVLGNIIR